jgi:hypothetical protein
MIFLIFFIQKLVSKLQKEKNIFKAKTKMLNFTNHVFNIMAALLMPALYAPLKYPNGTFVNLSQPNQSHVKQINSHDFESLTHTIQTNHSQEIAYNIIRPPITRICISTYTPLCACLAVDLI